MFFRNDRCAACLLWGDWAAFSFRFWRVMMCNMHKIFFGIVIVVVLAGGCALYARRAGVPVPAASVPAADDRIRVVVPVVDSLVASPLTVSGEARGMWYFEASFPLVVLDADRNEVAQGYAQADGEWMTEDFVPFSGTVEFTAPASDTGYIVFKKDNPSDLPEHDASVEIPVRFR